VSSFVKYPVYFGRSPEVLIKGGKISEPAATRAGYFKLTLKHKNGK
jgi:hypothetical protein